MCSVTLLGVMRNFPFNTQVYTEATVVDWSNTTGFMGLVAQLTREFRKTTAAKGTAKTLNKMFNEQNNGCAFAL